MMWANCSGCSPKMSKLLVFWANCSFAHYSLIFLEKEMCDSLADKFPSLVILLKHFVFSVTPNRVESSKIGHFISCVILYKQHWSNCLKSLSIVCLHVPCWLNLNYSSYSKCLSKPLKEKIYYCKLQNYFIQIL